MGGSLTPVCVAGFSGIHNHDESGMKEKIKVHQKWGFGMAPPKKLTVVLRQKASHLVLNALNREELKTSESLAEAISQVKGLFNRSLRMDQWDWFVVWEQLGLPERKRMLWIVRELVILRKSVVNNDPIAFKNSREQLQNWGALSSLKYFLGLERLRIEEDTGILYMLGVREMKGLLKIGFTERDITSRVNEINRATGILIPFGVRFVWRVRNPQQIEREVHKLLEDYRVRSDREFFNMEYNEAVRIINKFLLEADGLSRERGVIYRILSEKGYGFLSSDGKEFFFHAKEVKGRFSELKEGDTVEFNRLHTLHGYAASDIRRVM